MSFHNYFLGQLTGSVNALKCIAQDPYDFYRSCTWNCHAFGEEGERPTEAIWIER